MTASDEGLDQKCDEAIAAWLRGAPDDALRLFGAPGNRLLHRIDLHAVGAILAEQGADEAVPVVISSALRQRLLARELWEAQHCRVVAKALDALNGSRARPLLFKGTALAWSLYPRPAARIRGDSDVLIAEDQRSAACAALEAAAFERPLAGGGTVLMGEALFRGRDTMGRLHDIDLHWRTSNARVISRLFSHGELWERSAPLDALAPGARRICNVDALVIACVHRRQHLDPLAETHLNGVRYPALDRLIWLKDVDLLARALSDQELAELEDRARSKGLGRIVGAGLEDARRRLGTPLPEGLTEFLADAPPAAPDRYLTAGTVGQMAMNFAATKGLAEKLGFLRDLLFPPRAYMRERFRHLPRVPLPLLYVHRALGGSLKFVGWKSAP